VQPSGPPVSLSTASVYPEPVETAFRLAAELSYDGVELMVWSDPVSQDPAAVGRLAARYHVPVVAVHAPCLAVSQRVWGADPFHRLERSAAAAGELGAGIVVLHPPFRWQRRYVAGFAGAITSTAQRYGLRVAVENMYPVRRAGVRASPYAPGYDPTDAGYPDYTLDLSHTAASGLDALRLLERMGDGLVHVHLADGSGSTRDEHLVPGHGGQPCAQICERLAEEGFAGTVVVEVSTRRAKTRHDRVAMLAESLLFARLHLQPKPRVRSGGATDVSPADVGPAHPGRPGPAANPAR
jgi:sugar phosphate isomerase/epimerase